MLNVFEQSLGQSPLAQLVVYADGALAVASPKAQDLLQLPQGAEGLPFAALCERCGGLEVATLVQRACADDTPLTFSGEPWGDSGALNGGIVPVHNASGELIGATLTLERAEGPELAARNDALRRDVTELQSINDELRRRTDELNLVAIFLESVVTSLRGAVVVIDTRGTVRIWNPQAERLWGIRRREAMGTSLASLDLRTDRDALTPCIDAALRGELDVQERLLPVRRQDGAEAPCAVTATPLLGPGGTVHGVTLLFMERPAT